MKDWLRYSPPSEGGIFSAMLSFLGWYFPTSKLKAEKVEKHTDKMPEIRSPSQPVMSLGLPTYEEAVVKGNIFPPAKHE
jgi:hypothetical protein